MDTLESGSAIHWLEVRRRGVAPKDAAVEASHLPMPSGPLPVFTGVQPHLTGALRAAAAARAVAARIRATVAGGSASRVPEQPGGAAAAGGSTWRGLSVAEAAAASLAFRPLRRPFGRLPHGAPQHDLEPIPVAIACNPPRSEPSGPSAPSRADMASRVAGTIAELERLRRAARLQEVDPQALLMSARA